MQQATAPKTSRRSPAVASREVHVLVIDDDRHFRALARSLLEPNGIRVIEARGIGDGLGYLKAHDHEVAAVVLDLLLADGDGNQAIGELKTAFPKTKIIVVSAMDEQYLRTSKELGADAALPKCQVEYLSALLTRVLDR
jgi:CheY-like chemotaxis protein